MLSALLCGLLTALLYTLLRSRPVSAQTATVSVPLAAPSTAPLISPSLIGLSIEQDRWLDWSGNTSRNQFFFNTLNNLVGITGEPPHIRIGADSEDHTNFNPGIRFAQDVFPPPTTTVPYPEATQIVVGDGYYQATQFLPPGTQVTYGLDLGQNNLTAVFLQTQSILKAFASPAIVNAGIKLAFLEIGNEADLYGGNGLRTSKWNVSQYVQQWTQFATNVTAVAKLSASSETKFWGCAFGGSSHSTSGFSPQSAFNAGLLSSTPGGLINTISQHHYEGSFCSGNGGLLQDLMTKATIRSNLTSFSPDIAAVRAKNLDYVLGETNSYSCHGAPNVSNTAGAALWTLDYALFARQVGISRVFFHEGVGYKYNLIQPATLTRSILDGSNLPAPLAPHVQPQYYAAIIAGEAIGPSGKTQAVELSINNARVSGYAFFESGTLARAVLINSQAFLTTTTTPRSSVHIAFTFTGTNPPTSMAVKRLNITHADDASGLTWGGQTYETPDALVQGQLVVSTLNVSAGVDIRATEVVLLTFS